MALTYLALGDSYTIGEQVLLHENFPYAFVKMMRNEEVDILAPEIIAKTGWTTDELLAAMTAWTFREKYDIVTLIIGVNNQYRGRTVENFIPEFTQLLDFAIHKGAKRENVFVLSIPDWGITPFAAERNLEEIKEQIDAYNNACKNICEEKGISFIDITTGYRSRGGESIYLAEDKLHPSALEYAKWAEELKGAFVKRSET